MGYMKLTDTSNKHPQLWLAHEEEAYSPDEEHMVHTYIIAGGSLRSTRPTTLPAELDAPVSVPEVTAGTTVEEHVVVTGPPSTKPEAVPAEVITVPATEPATEPPTELAREPTTEAAPEVVTEVATEVATAKAEEVFTSEAAHAESTAAATDSPAAPTQEATQAAPVVEAATPTAAKEIETQAAEETEDVVVEDEGLSSGQVVGIVIGVLIAVVIVIAVVIAFVRRMGKYSAAKKAKIVKRKRASWFL
ncbi:hypothetical protein CRUP_009563 [Coryphaenoides rupestris]|nr:hypothetical protein CRUP_009563 [Coryphaenoides rupestris]